MTIATCKALRQALLHSKLDCLSAAHWIDHICVSAEHHAYSSVEVHHPEYHSPWAGKVVKLSDHHIVVAKVTLASSTPDGRQQPMVS
ncbi:MAG: hypothetical protein HGA45_36510 [Chloroflexales bacterium]|nr:hypothetical protein [Chloroflexales bacterium]